MEHDDCREAVTGPAPPPGDGLPSPKLLELDHVYRAMANARRRYLCYRLLETEERSLAALATEIAAGENGVPETEVTDDQHVRVYIALYHNHAPKLAAEGIVEFDETAETVRPGPNASQVRTALRAMGATEGGPTERAAEREDGDGEQ
jgi:hypothetical protein